MFEWFSNDAELGRAGRPALRLDFLVRTDNNPTMKFRNACRIVGLTCGLAFLMTSGCGKSKPTLYKSDVLGTSTNGDIIAETWFGHEIMNPSFWRIYLRRHGSTNLEPLFVVEAEFQEHEPGSPLFVRENGSERIEDGTRSYIFSLETRTFITNKWEGDVHPGNPRHLP
jgi:hypothetical protein